MNAELNEVVRKHALANALQYGSASVGAVAGKVFSELPQAKENRAETMLLVQEQVAKVNKLAKEEVESELKNYSFAEKKVEEKKLSLPGAFFGKVVTRFPPEPNGFAHIGHAKAAWLNRQFADDWGGKCLLRFDDTNPEAERQEYVDAVVRDLKWLGVQFDGPVLFASDFMPQLYEYAEKIISKNAAYVCSCSEEAVKLSREKGVECIHGEQDAKQNLPEWYKMVSGKAKQGEAIVRFKGDLKSNNTAMRDPTLFRVMATPHYRVGGKFFAWPTYDFEAAVVDSLTGVTHALRSKEYELRDELYYALLDALEMRKPVVYGFSRLALKGTTLSKRLLKPLIEEKKVSGWDDPRLPTIAGLRRRGILPAAIKEFVLSFGLSKVESRPDWEALLSLNRKLLDSSHRKFFVAEPVEIELVGVPPQAVLLRNHPADESAGKRKIEFSGKIFLQKKDLQEGLVRLKEFVVVELKKEGEKFFAAAAPEKMARVVQWVPSQPGAFAKAKLLKPGDLVDGNEEFRSDSLQLTEGVCESSCRELKEGDIVQFERVGFARLDDAQKMVFVQTC